MRDGLTANEVGATVFGAPPGGRRGYDEEVDAFLEDVEATIAKLDRSG